MANLSNARIRLNKYTSSAGDKMTQSRRKVRELSGEWQGQSEQAFEEAYGELHEKVNDMIRQFNRLTSKVNNLKSSIEAADRDMKIKVKKK